MKKNLHYAIILVLLFCSLNTMFSQQISVDDSTPLQQLIEDNLIQNGCVEISNITSSINGSANGFSSYAQFNRAGSNFPFQSGIMLTTGNALSGGNSETTPVLSEGASNWGGDTDLETALGISNTFNATAIEFDLISTSNQLQFNYLFASEEYFSTNPCNISDGFAFFIKESTSPAYQNIAVVPSTVIPVNTNTIHTDIFNSTGGLLCSAQNEEYFEGLGIGDTNYNGRTTTLTASATIIPYVQYHIKLVIADQNDIEYDSAVFIEGNSFKILDLGDDISSCLSSTLLDANIQNSLATYEWFLNSTAISGETNATLNATQSGTYRVEVTVPLNGSDCIEDDEIELVLNIEEPITPITPYQICDDPSNGVNTETFTLSTKDSELQGVIPFTSYSFSYHASDAEARSNSNSITTPIQNTTNPQPIFVRIADLDTGCFTYTSFDLVVNTLPTIVPPSPLEVCDSDDVPDGFAFIDLTEKDDEITGSDPDLTVQYYFNPTDANNSTNAITSLYRNRTTPTDAVYARVMNTATGCQSSTITLNINITVSPLINKDTQYIDACDTDHDGSATFDLTQVLNDVLNGLSSASVTSTYHESLSDAELGVNPIPNATAYQNIILEQQTVYIRIEDMATGCGSVAPIEIHTNLLLTGTDIQDFAVCDDNAIAGDELNFDLNVIEFFIANNLPDIIVTFYEDEADRDASNSNFIDNNVLFTAPDNTTLYIRIDNGSCSEIEDIRLLINPVLIFNPSAPLPYCDIDGDVTDGRTAIDLRSLDDLITNGNIDFITSYFPTSGDASSNNTTNQLPDFYTNSVATETIYVRIENIDTGCHTINSFDITVVASPETTTPSGIVICGTSNTETINLDPKIDEIVTSRTGLDFDFFTSLNDAEDNSSPIITPTAYNTGTQTIFVRISDVISSDACYKIESFEIIINAQPVYPAGGIKDFAICADEGETTADFLFSDKDADILNGQTGIEVYYFEDPGYTTSIDKTIPYNSADNVIYVRLESITDPNCSSDSSFNIDVASDPVFSAAVLPPVCDDASNDQKHTFNLQDAANQIQSSSTDALNISFHLTRALADTNANALPLPNYTNASNPQTLYVRIESGSSLCVVVQELNINIVAAPDLTEAQPLVVCDINDTDNYDSSATFDLTSADFDILDRAIGPPPIINYFENQADTDDDTKEITTPNDYISNSEVIFIKVTNQSTGCSSVIPLELVVNLPPVINTVTVVKECYSDTNTYDLSQADNLIVSDPNSVNITYHNNGADANGDTAAINANYNYPTTGDYPIWVRIENPSTGCGLTRSFILQINPNPVANTSPSPEQCDDDYDGFYSFNFSNTSATSNAIRGSQATSDHTVTYYDDAIKSIDKTDPLSASHPAEDGDLIFARIENNTTGCFSTTQFNVIVNEKPVIIVDDIIPICVNNLPLVINAETGNVGDLYLWSTGATTSQILLTNPTDIGDYWISITTPSTGCFATKFFEVLESAEAEINFTPTADFTDPNSITVEITQATLGDFVFSLDGGANQTSNFFDNVAIGPHIVTVTDLNGCEPVSKDVMVVDVPKFVTPNGDGNFDTWHITGVNELTGTVIYIYDRYGKLLKTLPHYSVGWDGTFNGANMPADDYWYVANVFYEGDEFQLKGHFALKR